MCGIFGYSIGGNVSKFQRGILAHTLARFNDERGGHSWGIVGALKRGGTVIHRGMGDLAPEIAIAAPYSAMYGHTRWATRGERTIANSHPFEVDHIVGAHNGMIYNHDELNQRYARGFPVDSQHVFAHLAEQRDPSELEGYGAIEWIDRSDPGAIYLARLARGELAIMGLGTPDRCSGVVWSSDDDHLYESLAAAGIWDAFEIDAPEGEILCVRGHRLQPTGDTFNLAERARVPFVDWRSFGREGARVGSCKLPLDGEDEPADPTAADDDDRDLPVDDFMRLNFGI